MVVNREEKSICELGVTCLGFHQDVRVDFGDKRIELGLIADLSSGEPPSL